MHDGMPYGRNQGQGQGHSREVDRQSPTGLIFSTAASIISSFSRTQNGLTFWHWLTHVALEYCMSIVVIDVNGLLADLQA